MVCLLSASGTVVISDADEVEISRCATEVAGNGNDAATSG